MRKYFIFNILCLFFLISCKNDSPKTAAELKPFFDVRGYFKSEIERLKGVKKVKKTVEVNGKREEKIVEITNWSVELAPFVSSDINRPAWLDKYLVKKNDLGNQVSRSEFYALADNLRTRYLLVTNDDSTETMTIEILNTVKTIATEAQAELKYDAHVGYQISTSQKLFGSADNMKVEVIFIKE